MIESPQNHDVNEKAAQNQANDTASLVSWTQHDNQAFKDAQPQTTAAAGDLTLTNAKQEQQQVEVERTRFGVGGAIVGGIAGAAVGEALFGRPYYPVPVPGPYYPNPYPYGNGPYYPTPYPYPTGPIIIGPGWGGGYHGGWHGGRRH